MSRYADCWYSDFSFDEEDYQNGYVEPLEFIKAYNKVCELVSLLKERIESLEERVKNCD